MAEANMAAVERIKAAKEKSLRLMKMDANGTLDKIAEGKRGNINDSFIEGNTTTTDSMINSVKSSQMRSIPTGGRMTGAGAQNVPAAIREAFMNNPIDDSALMMATMGGSGDLSFLNENVVQPTRTVPITEQIAPQQVSQPAPQVQVNAGIDYPMIRTIVEEIVRKYAVSLNKKILSEGKETTNQINTIALGETFKFLAKNGDIYECVMKKVGNINKKKKSVNE